MEFEDMQTIWNSQDDAKLFAINKAALRAEIKRKGRSVNRLLAFFEFIMIAVNLIVGIWLIIDLLGENRQAYQYALPALYLAYAVYALVRRLRRRQEVVRFDHTLLGELDKALWQIDYLIQQGRSMVLWYLLPLVLVAAVIMILNGKPLWALPTLLLVPFTYFAGRWEVNRFYLPKKQALEALREKLLASQGVFKTS